MAPPEPAAAGAAGPRPSPLHLGELREKSADLSDIVKVTELTPDLLDVQAKQVHTELVMPAYSWLKDEVARACGADWAVSDQQRLKAKYATAARKWPAYRQAVQELESARTHGRSEVIAQRRLETPRDEYIFALASFAVEVSAVLNKFFPGP
jgi:hypothetical protein